jgi:hypothetical protein
MVHVEKAVAVATGRCRAIVRVPWDSRLAGEGALGTAPVPTDTAPTDTAPTNTLSAKTLQAYTALAGVLVSSLGGPAAPAQSAGAANSAATPTARVRSAEE